MSQNNFRSFSLVKRPRVHEPNNNIVTNEMLVLIKDFALQNNAVAITSLKQNFHFSATQIREMMSCLWHGQQSI